MQLPELEAAILVLVNQHRSKLGLEPLQAQKDIIEAAKQHSQKMASGQASIGHEGFEKRAAQLLTLLNGITAAENVAYGQNTAEEAFDSWLASPGHRQNIEGAYNLTGLGVVPDGEGRNVFTQIFLAVQAQHQAPQPTDDELSITILSEINNHRIESQLGPLLLDEDIQAAAQAHSRKMASGQIPLGYDGLREALTKLAQQLKGRAVAANIAQAKPHADKIIETWLASAAHCKNIEGNYSRTGLGVAHNEKGDYYITQLFVLC